MTSELTEAEKLFGYVFFGGLAVICFFFFGWYPRYQASQSEIADAQIERGDLGGCLGTSAKTMGTLLVVTVVGILFVLGMLNEVAPKINGTP